MVKTLKAAVIICDIIIGLRDDGYIRELHLVARKTIDGDKLLDENLKRSIQLGLNKEEALFYCT